MLIGSRLNFLRVQHGNGDVLGVLRVIRVRDGNRRGDGLTRLRVGRNLHGHLTGARIDGDLRIIRLYRGTGRQVLIADIRQCHRVTGLRGSSRGPSRGVRGSILSTGSRSLNGDVHDNLILRAVWIGHRDGGLQNVARLRILGHGDSHLPGLRIHLKRGIIRFESATSRQR